MTEPTTCFTDDLPDLPHVSFRLIRNIDVDADGNKEMVSLALNAKAELSYYLFDGEEFPSLRFRDMTMGDDGTYSVTVDIVVPEGKNEEEYLEYAKGKLLSATKDNLISFVSAARAESTTEVIAFAGSGAGELGWIPQAIALQEQDSGTDKADNKFNSRF